MKKLMVKKALWLLVMGLLGANVTANAGVVFSDDFSTDPFASPARWAITYQQDIGSYPAWNATGENVKFLGKQSNMRTTGNFTLTTQQPVCYIQTDCMFTDTSGGSWINLVAMLKADGSDGYRLGFYNHGSYSRTEWSKDSRLTTVSGGANMPLLSTNKWYVLKVEMFDDTVNDKTVVKGYVYDKAASSFVGSITLEDTSGTRLKTHQNMEIRIYPGNSGGVSGAFVDNVSVGATDVATIFSDDFQIHSVSGGNGENWVRNPANTAAAIATYTNSGPAGTGDTALVKQGSPTSSKTSISTTGNNWYSIANPNKFIVEYDYKFLYGGSQARIIADSDNDMTNGYEVQVYPNSAGKASLYISRITSWPTVQGGDPGSTTLANTASTLFAGSVGTWNHVKFEIEIQSGRNVLTLTATSGSDSNQLALTYTDTDAARITNVSALGLWAYRNGLDSDPAVDNILVTAVVPPPPQGTLIIVQ